MKHLIIFLLLTNISFSQKSLINDGLKIGQKVPDITLFDTSGKKVKLSSFKGKILYLDFWATFCGPCIKVFPDENQLHARIKKLELDTTVLFIKICGSSPIKEWKEIIKKHKSTATNLILPGSDYKIWRRFKIPAYPTYQIVGRDFNYLGTYVSRPNDPDIDYFLFRAIDNIDFEQASKELQARRK